MNLKKTFSLLAGLCLCAALFAGCGTSTYSATSFAGKLTIRIRQAKDGDSFESNMLSISNKKTIFIDSDLEKGGLDISFVKVMNLAEPDEAENLVEIETAETVTIGPGEEKSFSLADSADYQIRLKAIGETSGTLVIEIKN